MKLIIVLLSTAAIALGSPARIVGGQNAAENQFPYQVTLRADDVFFCGGSILDETTILTAAHCAYGEYVNDLTVTVGNNNLNLQTEVYAVERYTVHENYTSSPRSDVAILKLKTPIKFREGVRPIALRKTDIAGGEDVVLSGWGRTKRQGPIPEQLQFIHLKTLSLKDCANKIGETENDKEVCTLTHYGEGACNGDSGGPLVDKNGEQVGIVSWGYPCGIGYPDMYARIYTHLEWIENHRY